MENTPQVFCYMVWSAQQVADCIEGHDKKNEIIKVEVTHGSYKIGERAYQVIVWCHPQPNETA